MNSIEKKITELQKEIFRLELKKITSCNYEFISYANRKIKSIENKITIVLETSK
jgi:hypothetical protein